MKNYVQVIMVCIAIFGTRIAAAQAYDGQNERKIYLGYANVLGYSGIVLKGESGASNLISFGGTITYLIIKAGSTYADVSDNKYSRIFKNSEFNIFLNFHLNEPFHLIDKMDVYIGPFCSLKSTGIEIGYKYNFSERLGTLFELSKGFINFHTIDSSTTNSIKTPFEKKLQFSLGLTYNLM